MADNPGTYTPPTSPSTPVGETICIDFFHYVRVGAVLRGPFDTPEQAEEWYDEQIQPWLPHN